MTQTKQDRPAANGPAQEITATTSIDRVSRTSDFPHHGLLRFPVAFATAYGPAGRRKRCCAMVRCPGCGGGHLIFGGTLADLAGVKNTPCGSGKVWVAVARTVLVTEAVSDAAA